MQLHCFLTPVALGTAALLFALLALRDEVHLLAVGLGDALSHYAFIEAAQQLLDGLSFASFDFHCLRDGCERFGPGLPRWRQITRLSLLSPPPA
jgi:hypothetical protein